MKKKTKLIGVKFDYKKNDKNEKVYYYETDKNLKVGDIIEIKAPTGGKPDCLIVDIKKNDNERKYKRVWNIPFLFKKMLSKRYLL